MLKLERLRFNSLGKSLSSYFLRVTKDSFEAFYELAKILLPVIILVKIGVELGLIEKLSNILAPVMSVVGLSGEMGIVWATSILTNIYAGLIAISSLSSTSHIDVGQFTIICTMVLIAHSIPIETVIARKCGVKSWFIVFIRIFLAFLSGFILKHIYANYPEFQERVVFELASVSTSPTLFEWAKGELFKLAAIFGIIWILLHFIELVKITKLENLLLRILNPLLKPIGITKASSNLLMAALLLGMSYGGALIIKESSSGRISKREVFACITFLTIAHALVEETLLTMAFGAHISGVLGARVISGYLLTIIVLQFPSLVDFLMVDKKD